MARLPNDGETNWGVTLNEFLRVAHQEDGTLKHIFIDPDSGSVGIGTTTPGAREIDGQRPILDVKGYTSLNGLRVGLDGYNDILSDNKYGLTITSLSSDPDGKMDFKTGGNEASKIRMRISSAGNIGIGTNAPSAKLDISVPGSDDHRDTDSDWLFLGQRDTSGGYAIHNFWGSDEEATPNRLAIGYQQVREYLYPSYPQRPYLLVINGPTGQIGIDEDQPEAKLHVSGSDYGDPHGKDAAICLENTAALPNSITNGPQKWFVRAGAEGTDTPEGGFSIADEGNYRLVIDKNGNVGIGLRRPAGYPPAEPYPRQPQARLHVVGDVKVEGNIINNGRTITASDVALKKDIEPVSEALERVQALRGVHFSWRSGDPGRSMGLIAQEVEAVFPEAVEVISDGTKGIDYAMLIAPLVEAIKAQQREIESLRREMALYMEA